MSVLGVGSLSRGSPCKEISIKGVSVQGSVSIWGLGGSLSRGSLSGESLSIGRAPSGGGFTWLEIKNPLTIVQCYGLL